MTISNTAVLIISLLVFSMVFESFTMASNVTGQDRWWKSGRTERLRKNRGSSSSSQQTLAPQTITAAVHFAQLSMSRLVRLEQSLRSSDVVLQSGTAAHGAFIASMPSTKQALLKHSEAQVALIASKYMAENNCHKFNLKERRCGTLVNSVSLVGTSLAASCLPSPPPKCDSQYRTIDGSCNNIVNKTWGASLTAYRRLLPPSYANGLDSPRGGKKLPNPRVASKALVTSDTTSISEVTLATAIWTQFVSMDIAHTPTAKMLNTGSNIACCKPNGEKLPPRSRHPACLPITVDVHTAGRNGRRCLDFVRSLIAPRPDCCFGFAEQMNQATHWLDGSSLYGSNDETSKELREMKDGRLQLSEGLLPLANNPYLSCQLKTGESCFRSGDSRVNENPLMTSLVTVLAREHNRVANKLANLNPQWDDETLFQEARRIVIAQMQHITYQQWLPLLIGETSARDVNSAKYSSHINPSTINSLATLPFTLSMLPTSIQLHEESRVTNGTLRLRQHYNRPAVVSKTGSLDSLVRTLATQQAHSVDLLHTKDVTDNMYAAEGALGLDAVSLVIQRGRDHGLPGYNAFRSVCGLTEAKVFNDFVGLMDRETVQRLSTVYDNVNDVDLYIGAVAEHAKDKKVLLGPTLTCLLSKQLTDTRRSDRFFYDLATGFSTAQLVDLQKSNLAKIFCDNGENIRGMQPDVFRPPGSTQNIIVPCNQIPGPNFEAWRTQKATR